MNPQPSVYKTAALTLKATSACRGVLSVARRGVLRVVKQNRKDAYLECEAYINELYENELLTKEQLEADIRKILDGEKYEAYDGVRIFLLKRACENLGV